MQTKKKFLIGFGVLFLILALTACSKNRTPVDILSEDGKYHYYNDDLGFEISFPEEFQYYLTQRINNPEFIDLEYFVPTTDYSYPLDFSNYAEAVVLRVINKDFWEDNKEGHNEEYQILGESKKRVYVIKIWEEVPADWQEKWSEEMKNEIINSFKIK